MKNMINSFQECQFTLLNYKKGGEPFINLVTVIPISWNSIGPSLLIGFQVDLVKQPQSILNQMKGIGFIKESN